MLKSIALCIAPVTFAACLTQEATPEETGRADFHDANGNAWRMRGPAKIASADTLPERVQSSELRTAGLPSTDSERAAGLRPVAYFDGNEYELVATDEELLARYEALAASGPMGGAPGRPHVQTPGAVANVIGGEDRVPLGWNSVYYPNSAVGASDSIPYPPHFGYGSHGCTMTMIGPSTAISAAHCFYTPGVGWHPTKSWTFGVTSYIVQGTTSVTVDVHQAWPTYTGCYWVTVPGAWTTLRPHNPWTSSDFFYDFAVIEFSNSQAPTCNLFPGTTLGWYGWWTASDDQIAQHNARINGYPHIPTEYARTYAWPTQFTEGDYIGNVFSPSYENYLIHTKMDVTHGNSGSALAQELFTPGDRYATGIVTAEGVGYNVARRIDATVRNFVLQYSAL
jgi:V8-like Glu-specific endopeptidase